jgi:hypothetical protein
MENDLSTINGIQNRILQFRADPHIQKLINLYYTKSITEILGVSRRELSHSRFLAWLLNDQESHGLGDFFLKQFLEVVARQCLTKNLSVDSELLNQILVGTLSIQDVKTESEKDLGEAGRLDIYVECKIRMKEEKTLALIIENKVLSKEGKDQTKRYFTYFGPSSPNKIHLFVYLNAISNQDIDELQAPECECNEFIQINYQSLVDFLLEPALEKSITNKTRFILEDYLQSLTQPSFNYESENYNRGLIMALRQEEKLLLDEFWRKYKDLIGAAVNALINNGDMEAEDKEKAQGFLEVINPPKDRSLFSLYYNKDLVISNSRKSNIGLALMEVLLKYNLLNQNIINILKEDKSTGFSFLKEVGDLTENERKHNRYGSSDRLPDLQFEGKDYFISRNWGQKNVIKFLDKMKAYFPELSYSNLEPVK